MGKNVEIIKIDLGIDITEAWVIIGMLIQQEYDWQETQINKITAELLNSYCCRYA